MLENLPQLEAYSIQQISFSDIKNYWIQTNHFASTDSKIGEYIRQLGPYYSDFEKPPYKAFGLFHNSELVGVTKMVLWNKNWVRYRTINIQPSHRGHGLGIMLLKEAHQKSWPELDIFGWVRKAHLKWSLKHGFQPVDQIWHGDHMAMVLNKKLIRGR